MDACVVEARGQLDVLAEVQAGAGPLVRLRDHRLTARRHRLLVSAIQGRWAETGNVHEFEFDLMFYNTNPPFSLPNKYLQLAGIQPGKA